MSRTGEMRGVRGTVDDEMLTMVDMFEQGESVAPAPKGVKGCRVSRREASLWAEIMVESEEVRLRAGRQGVQRALAEFSAE